MTGSSFVWTDAGVREALALGGGSQSVTYTGVSTDSRDVTDGQLYVALVGDRFDGHDFVADALSRGARGAVVTRAWSASGGPTTSAPVYRVDDTLVALGALAAHRRARITVPVVGITGSSGKTTTKDLTAAALRSAKRVHATRGNRNNRVGLPLTLLSAPDDAEALVLEMGTNEPGEIRTLAQIARPDIGVVTTVGESHLEKLGSVEGVLEEKLDLLRGVAAGGRCLVGDEPEALAERARTICPRLRVAGWTQRADADLRPENARADATGRYDLTWRGEAVSLRLVGRHAVADAMLALAVAELLGVSAADAARGISGTETHSLRGEIRRLASLTLVVDCYNANPQSVRAALDLLAAQRAERRVAVLGSMLELGTESDRLHRDVLANALARGFDLVVATGRFADAAAALGAAGRADVITAADWQSAYPALRDRLEGGEVVLLKASRGIALEGILPLLERDFLGDTAVSA
ncbi:MAG: UDP-N-acetylmuramoyl-tripeptide--D-alanyl-D-alanine ligase [Gemmatimonadales bacterium]